MPRTQALPPAARAFLVAMRLWHTDRDTWWVRMEPLADRLERRAGHTLLMALDGLMTVLAEHALADIALRPVACRHLTPDERTLVAALDCALDGDAAGCHDALSGVLDGENLRFALSLLDGIAGHLAAFAATVEPPAGDAATLTAAAHPAAHC